MVRAPNKRLAFTAVWTGTEMIIWGGYIPTGPTAFNTGARYNPTTVTWTPMSTVDAPSARSGHRAVWNGTKMIVWGWDGLGFTYTNTGASTTRSRTPGSDRPPLSMRPRRGAVMRWSGRGRG